MHNNKKNINMKKVVRLSESDLTKLVKRVIKEMSVEGGPVKQCLIDNGLDPDSFDKCKAAYENPTKENVKTCWQQLVEKVNFAKLASVGKCIVEKTNIPVKF